MTNSFYTSSFGKAKISRLCNWVRYKAKISPYGRNDKIGLIGSYY